MSTQGIRDFRPEVHYTAEKGWINDPNGLTYVDGTYHLFAQYYPEPRKGPKHWSHAVSQDLLHWQELPVALYPDKLGAAFSGSAVYDKENVTGLGTRENPPLVAMYTSHSHMEQQSLAASNDPGFRNFLKYRGNPVLSNGEDRIFRDPKVFPNPIRGGWSVAITMTDRVAFFASKDLKHWEKTGEFGPEGNFMPGQWQCPDLFPLTIHGEEKWVLVISMGHQRTQYFTGTFDGDTFHCDVPYQPVKLLDQGFDNYAGVTFNGTEDRLLVAWATSWVYARKLPTGVFCGYLSMPRRLSLADTPKGGLRLAAVPAAQPFQAAPYSAGELPGELFGLKVKGEGAATVRLENRLGQHFDFGVNEKGEVFVDRSQAGAKDFDPQFASEKFSQTSAPRYYDGAWELELHFDHSISELYADGGTLTFTQLVYPDEPYTRASVAEGSAQVEVYALAAR